MAGAILRSTTSKQKYSYRCSSGSEHFHLVTCMFSDLRKAPKIRQYPPNTNFLLGSYYCEKLNAFNIIPLHDEEDDLFRMSEHIWNIVEETDLFLGRTPTTHQVVLAPNKGLYCRAVVLKVVDDVQAEVYFFDVGGFAIVEVDKLKPLNVPITRFPVLGHHVILRGVHSSSSKILWRQFQREIEAISKKLITIEYVDNSPAVLKHPKIKGLVSQRTVDIFYQLEGQKKSLRDTIEGMEKWEWEKYSNLKGDDEEICTKGKFGTSLRIADEVIVAYVDLKPGTIFTALVSRIPCKDTDNETDLAELELVFLDEPMHKNYFNALHYQLKRYTNHIKKSTFFPTMNEPLMFKLNDMEKYKDSVKLLGRWVRAVRLSAEMIYLLDFDDFVPFDHLPQEDYEMRRLYREFWSIPNLTVCVRPFENGKQLTVKEANEKLPAMNRYKFSIIKIIKMSNNGCTYDVNFGPVPSPSK